MSNLDAGDDHNYNRNDEHRAEFTSHADFIPPKSRLDTAYTKGLEDANIALQTRVEEQNQVIRDQRLEIEALQLTVVRMSVHCVITDDESSSPFRTRVRSE